VPVRVPEVEEARESGPTVPRGRVLVVEDDAALRTLITERLAMAGWQVRATADPWSTLASPGQFDLALVDLHLKGEALSESFLASVSRASWR
jgi:DNA-binding NtrC family response regulator